MELTKTPIPIERKDHHNGTNIKPVQSTSSTNSENHIFPAYKKAIELGDQDAEKALKDCMSKMETYERLIFGDLAGSDDQPPKPPES